MKTRGLRFLWGLAGLCVLALSIHPLAAASGGPILAMAVMAGVRATAGTVSVDSSSRVIDMSDAIDLLDPNIDPLTALTRRLRKAHCINPKFEWAEDDYVPSAGQINASGGYTAGATAFTVDGGTLLRARDVIRIIRTGEQMRATTDGTAVLTGTMTRGTGAGVTAAAALVDNDTFIVIGTASPEGATAPTILSTGKTFQYNYTQIHRWPFGATRTAQSSELYGGDDIGFQGKKAGLEHKIQIEKSSLFGERKENAAGAAAIRTSDGVLRLITTNVVDADSVLTLDIMEGFLKNLYRYGSSEKLLFCSRTVMSVLNRLASQYIHTVPTTESFPLRIKQWDSGHGDIYLVNHNLLTTPFASAPTESDRAYDGWAIGIDMNAVYYRYLQKGGATHIRTNIQANDEDGRRDEYLTECGIQLVSEKKHGILKDVATA